MKRLAYILIMAAMVPLNRGCQKIENSPEPDNGINFSGCIIPGTSSSLEVVTFNIESFPKQGALTIDAVAKLIKTIDPDIVALQELTSEAFFNALVAKMPGWTGQYYLINNSDWNLAYLFKDSEINYSTSSAKLLFSGDTYAFPRPPLEVQITHKPTGINAYLLNLHLKCCGGTDNIARRRDAAEKLHEYVVTQRDDDAVIILGDWNDEITSDPAASHPFHVFLTNADSYRFTDISIATGSLLWWSYPSWPSHIDHILVTDELFFRVDTTMTYKPEPCYPSYNTVISDHRPVGVVIK
ncbi:MAG: endonuclease/exonuclease/phosphatase family protein [Bacteroidales bacterium]|nr:endonuclease/exonuclease/phosphatase family protein [Bacteroidales bacterium]